MEIFRFAKNPIKYINDSIERIRLSTPKEKTLLVRYWATFLAKCVGCEVTDPNYKPYWLTLISVLLTVDVISLCVYTIVYYSRENNHMKCLEVVSLIGVIVPTLIHFNMALWPRNIAIVRTLLFFGNDFVYPNKKDGQLDLILDKRATQLIRNAILIFCTLNFATVFYITYPVYTYLVDGAHPMPVPVIVPFFHPDTDLGYYVSLINQVVLATFTLLGNLAIEVMVTILVNNLWGAADVIKYSLDQISRGKYGEADRKIKLRNILVQIQDLDRYSTVLGDMYYYKYFLQPVLASISISIAIFCHMQGGWTSGGGYAAFIYIQLQILCYTGNEVKDVYVSIAASLYQSKWYAFSRGEQMDIAHMMNRLQNGCSLSIGPFVELNFETGTSITKSIYSYLMMLLEFRPTD